MEEEKLKGFFSGKKLYLTLFLGIAGILLIILGSSGFLSGREEKKIDIKESETVFSYTEFLEKKVSGMVSRLCGGKASVLITLDCSSESVYAGNISENTGTGVTEREYLVLSGENTEGGLFLKEIYPRIRGIAVVCPGGGNTGTQLEVIKMLSVAFGISSSKVSVSGTG